MPVGNPSIVYRPREDATAEAEAHALAEIYRLILFESSAKTKATEPAPEPDDRDDYKRLVSEDRGLT